MLQQLITHLSSSLDPSALSISISPTPALLTATSISAFLIYAILRDKRPDKSFPMAHIDWPIIGNLVNIAIGTYQGLELYNHLDRANLYGAYWSRVPVNGIQLYITDPPSIKVLLDDLDSFALPPSRKIRAGDIFGDGIFVSNGDSWHYQRNLARPLFDLQSRTDMFATYHKAGHDLISVLTDLSQTSAPTELQQLFKRFTLDTFGEVGFGYTIRSLVSPIPFSSSFDWIFQELDFRTKFPWRKWTNAAQWNHHLQVVEEFISQIISDRRKEGWAGKKDFLSWVLEMEARNEIPGSSEKFLRDQVMNFMIAGRDTTAELLASTFYYLCQYPEVQQKVIDEIKKVVGNETVTMQHTKSLRYLKNVLDEALRLFPPAVPINSRICLRDIVLPNKARIPKGAHVSYSPFVVHRLKAHWGENANLFYPERWEDPNTLKHPYQFLPFQKGPRQCLGMNMAYEEAKCCIAIIYQNGFRFELARKEDPLLLNPTSILHARNGIWVTVKKESNK